MYFPIEEIGPASALRVANLLQSAFPNLHMHFNHNGFATSELSDAFLIFFLVFLLPLCASGLSTPRPCFAQRVFRTVV